MVIEASLSKEQYIRLAIWRHIQRNSFYFYALTCAGLTAYGIVQGQLVWLLAGWVPFLLYLSFGVVSAFRGGANRDNPLFLPTRYEFNQQGVLINTEQGKSKLEWTHFAGWKTIAECYVLILSAGPVLAIPKSAVPVTQISKFESLLKKHIGG